MARSGTVRVARGTPQDHEALRWFSLARPDQMGAQVAVFRNRISGATWAKGTALGGCIGVAMAILVVLIAPPESSSAGPFVAFFLCVLLVDGILLALVLVARSYRHAVHEHGLVLTSPGSRTPEVVPWATLDPGRVFIPDSIRAHIRMPLASHRQRALFPPGLVINGWTNRPRGGPEIFEEFSSNYRYQPMPITSPFGWWQLSTGGDPRGMLETIESAMVADGYSASGLTDFALSRRVNARDMRTDPSLQAERALEDGVLGVPRRFRGST